MEYKKDDYSDAGDDFLLLQDELRKHPESIAEDDLLRIMKIFNDSCYELSWQMTLSEILTINLIYFGETRMKLYLENLNLVPEGGRFHGWRCPVQMLIADKEASVVFEKVALSQTDEVKKVLGGILQSLNIDSELKDKLKRNIQSNG
jgi:hypothetical protein